MDIQDTKEQRQAFEAWCIQWNIASVFPLDDEGQYSDYNIHLLYCAWLQGQAAKAQAVPEGFVVVPKELSDEKANKMAKDEFSKISSLFHMEHRSEPDNSVEQLKRIWIANKIRNLKLFHKLFIGAQEPTND